MKNKFAGLALITFAFAVAGIVISSLTIKEDVISTAHTIFEYFPMKYGVTPATTWDGAVVLAVFTSVLQVVAASVAFSKFSLSNRVVAGLALVLSLGFDNWTDVVFRSGNLTGNLQIAWVTTLAFYTAGSEIMQGLSWLVVLSTWRPAISDFMWGLSRFEAGISSISGEWSSFQRAARNKEGSERFKPNPHTIHRNYEANRENQPIPSVFRQNLEKIKKEQDKTQSKIVFPIKSDRKNN